MTEASMRADRMISNIREKLDYQRYMTPKNFREENARFLAAYEVGEVYNPQYIYELMAEDMKEEIKAALAELSQEDLPALLQSEREALSAEAEMYQHIGQPMFTALAKAVHGNPNPAFYERALEAAAPGEAAPDLEKSLSAEVLRDTFAARIERYGFDWKILVRPDMTSKVSVDPDRREIWINAAKTFSEQDLVRLQAHEIDTHVLRTENGAKRGLGIFVSGTAGSLIHEEGLALYNEAKQQVMDREMLRLYAGRFISCLFLEESSFYESFDRLVKMGYSLDQAMYIVARVKRGICDTSQGGGFVKDYVYLQGFYEVSEAIEAHPEIYEQMYYGGVSLSNLEALQVEIQQAQAAGQVILPIGR